MSNSPFEHKINNVLVDWHGVLGSRGFWCDQSKKSRDIGKFCDFLFSDSALVGKWMSDGLTTDDLTSLAFTRFGISKDILIETFQKDVPEYGPRLNILKWIEAMFPDSRKILFSENPVMFKDYVLNTNEQVKSYFDHIFLSCDYGVLKIGTGETLFDRLREQLDVTTFDDFVLIDDKYENCEFFRKLGGHYINFT